MEPIESFSLDLRPVISGEKQEIPFSFSFIPTFLPSDVSFPSALTASGRVYEKASAGRNAESLIECTITLSGTYETSCARCLEALSLPMEVSETYAVALSLQNEDEGNFLMAQSGMIDLFEAADALFELNIPSKHLCREDCKGLCPVCGINKNRAECHCEQKKIDPRLAVLKKYLDKSENS